MKLNHIVAATDFSAPARHAVERAALVSRETGAPLDLLHMANLAPLERLRQLMLETPEDLEQRLVDAGQEKLHELAEALRKRFDVSAGTRVVSGSVLAELEREADAMAADLIVCGARGESFILNLLLGSTAERMLSGTKCPMLVVKQAAHEPYRTLLVPVDFSPSSLRAIGKARAVAPQADIVLLHVFDVPFEGQLRYAGVDEDSINDYRVIARQAAIRKLHALGEEAGLPPYAARYVVLHGDPCWRIVEQEQDLSCDLTVMGKHGENTLQDLFVGCVTRHVLAQSQGDVLVSV
ncbi:MAG: universal stress protein [Candidatus Accumulibacter sp.]|uniref:Universal stress protein n=1 Tax=Candidatus Accumulibacter affinis TaxID=2954384 RepID=A0A935W8D3_9PROT|nr:universal stress protein [Candidatus Accumulibacter affinis]MBP9805195.1 universal stress protein [Accumulibacter sp.]